MNKSKIYIKIPFINEEFKRRASAVARPLGLSNVKIHFENGEPSFGQSSSHV